MKLPFILLLDLKGRHLAAIVFLKFTVRNVYATGKLIVACSEDILLWEITVELSEPCFQRSVSSAGSFSSIALLRSGAGPQV